MIGGLLPTDFLDHYDSLAGFFDSFVERSGGATQVGELEADVLSGQRQCAVVVKGDRIVACGLSKVEVPPRLVVTHCSGEGAEEWGEGLLDYYEEWADAKCGGRLVVACRPGWVRLLDMRKRGYAETHRIMERG